jgi:hypothetical protein
MWNKWDLLIPQAVKLPAVHSSPQYKKKRSFCSENSPKVNNRPLYKKLQLAYLDLSQARNQAQNSENVNECLATELYHPVPVVR